MTGRTNIEPDADGWRRLSYTRRCGWIDWGHATPKNAASLWRSLRVEAAIDPQLSRPDVSFGGSPAFVVSFGEEMGAVGHKVSTEHHWIVKKGLSLERKQQAALGIFMAGSHEFETLQSRRPWAWGTDSGYSGEDLMSNLVGFYAAVRGLKLQQMRAICGEVSVKESYRIWDKYLPGGLGRLKNRSARPILFPTEDGKRGDTAFPALLATIKPSPEGQDWVRPQGGFVSRRLIDMGARITVDRTGRVDAARPGTIAMPLRTGR